VAKKEPLYPHIPKRLGSEHASNLPRSFETCPACGRQGLYKLFTPSARGTRCKYCKYEKWYFTR
jgi:uncharacterized protein (DUF983 family)